MKNRLLIKDKRENFSNELIPSKKINLGRNLKDQVLSDVTVFRTDFSSKNRITNVDNHKNIRNDESDRIIRWI
jgi:outer membrane receptor for ferrienterochelin and colicin